MTDYEKNNITYGEWHETRFNVFQVTNKYRLHLEDKWLWW